MDYQVLEFRKVPAPPLSLSEEDEKKLAPAVERCDDVDCDDDENDYGAL